MFLPTISFLCVIPIVASRSMWLDATPKSPQPHARKDRHGIPLGIPSVETAAEKPSTSVRHNTHTYSLSLSLELSYLRTYSATSPSEHQWQRLRLQHDAHTLPAHPPQNLRDLSTPQKAACSSGARTSRPWKTLPAIEPPASWALETLAACSTTRVIRFGCGDPQYQLTGVLVPGEDLDLGVLLILGVQDGRCEERVDKWLCD
jgi:hypothetical protein